jgi:hypothetical protein
MKFRSQIANWTRGTNEKEHLRSATKAEHYQPVLYVMQERPRIGCDLDGKTMGNEVQCVPRA